MRNTCELCEHEHLNECRYCELSSEPNPEAFTRNELVMALNNSLNYNESSKEIEVKIITNEDELITLKGKPIPLNKLTDLYKDVNKYFKEMGNEYES